MIEMHQAVACSRRRARVSLVAYKSQRGEKRAPDSRVQYPSDIGSLLRTGLLYAHSLKRESGWR